MDGRVHAAGVAASRPWHRARPGGHLFGRPGRVRPAPPRLRASGVHAYRSQAGRACEPALSRPSAFPVECATERNVREPEDVTRVGTESDTLKRTASRVAWSIFVLIVLSTVAGEAFSAAEGSGVDGFAIFVMSFPLVGALIVSSRPDNKVGWVMLGIGALLGVSELLETYAVFRLDVRPGSLPAPGVALALNAPMWVPVIGLPGTFLILLFPDGRLPSSRWRPWGWFCLAALVLSYLVILIQPYEFVDEGYPGVTNPFGIDAMASFAGPLLATLLSIPIAIVGCALVLRQRFRRSRGLNRLQLKWLAAAARMVAAGYGVSTVGNLAFRINGRGA